MTTFPSKLLLFGEYSIIKGAQALAIPFSRYNGQWEYGGEAYNLAEWGDYLLNLQQKGDLLADLDVVAFQAALAKGLNFKSSIPTGYGVGSSGALCAAVYHTYKQGLAPQNPIELKQLLAQLESFFHGASSGIDPLVSYLKQGVWVQSKVQIQTIPSDFLSRLKSDFFLIDTHQARQTAPLVRVFNEKHESNAAFRQTIKEVLIPLTNQTIQSFLAKKESDLFQNIHQTSDIQLHHFKEMIPSKFQQIWQNGLLSNIYKLKLCGAGGGGFILGISNDFEKTATILADFSIQKIDFQNDNKIVGRIF